MSLGALLWRYLILTGVSAAALAAAWWITLMLLMNAGFVLPARTQSDHASDAAAAMRLQGSFDASLADELCNYVYFAPDGAGRAVFTVQDTGPGFTPEALAKGMQPLYTGEKSRPQDGHMGLGLTFAADVARRHGGALALRNAAGGGAVAELSFPVWG